MYSVGYSCVPLMKLSRTKEKQMKKKRIVVMVPYTVGSNVFAVDDFGQKIIEGKVVNVIINNYSVTDKSTINNIVYDIAELKTGKTGSFLQSFLFDTFDDALKSFQKREELDFIRLKNSLTNQIENYQLPKNIEIRKELNNILKSIKKQK